MRAARRQREGAAVDRSAFPYRMKDLCERTGLPRQVVHFYIQQGLLPEGHKTGRNMAFYGEQHIERIRLIRQLQEERFLPLKAIRAMLEERDDAFTPGQRQLLHELRERLGPELGGAGSRQTVPASELLRRTGVSRQDLERMVELGLLATRQERGRTVVARDEAWLLELWGQLREAGFTEARGFGVDDLLLYQESISALIAQEARLLTERFQGLPLEEGARMLERALPLINTLLARYHTTQARHFLASH